MKSFLRPQQHHLLRHRHLLLPQQQQVQYHILFLKSQLIPELLLLLSLLNFQLMFSRLPFFLSLIFSAFFPLHWSPAECFKKIVLVIYLNKYDVCIILTKILCYASAAGVALVAALASGSTAFEVSGLFCNAPITRCIGDINKPITSPIISFFVFILVSDTN